ncbi:hypothetical protein MNBD_GAMMA13-1031 [hydrothermal vent metagenome]|uniref:General secretion pathway GspH domain-containing protein n=1 Tax=hydrothermal vent metagenome TaxID=652676 RepID=A0A3B0YLD9_9ZZZZ
MDDKRPSGFTLIELLLSVTIMALLAGLAMPSMAQFLEAHRLRGAAEALAQTLRHARNHALTYQTSIHFTAAVQATQTWCYGWSERERCRCQAPLREADACTRGDADSARLQRQTSSAYPSVTLSLTRLVSARYLTFNPVRGTASADTLVLNNRAGELRVIVSPLGRIRVCSVSLRGYPSC